MGRIGTMLGEPLTVLVTRKIVDRVTIVLIAMRKWCRIGLIIGREGGIRIVIVVALANFTAWNFSDCYGKIIPLNFQQLLYGLYEKQS